MNAGLSVRTVIRRNYCGRSSFETKPDISLVPGAGKLIRIPDEAGVHCRRPTDGDNKQHRKQPGKIT